MQHKEDVVVTKSEDTKVAAEKGFEQFARTTKKVSSDRHPIDL
jgi:hypothetical protein